jgi:hypothetical protein
MCVATPCRDGWALAAPEPVGPPEDLFARLTARAAGAPVAFGIDCPIGLPRAYVARHAITGDFPTFLCALAGSPAFFEVARSLADVGKHAPFYPARGVAGMTRLAHATALGLPDAAALSRACDRATAERPAGAPVFWTLGANQSGKAAIAAWRHLLIPALHQPAPPSLWPFAGPFCSLLRPGRVAVAETYPAEAMRHLGLRVHGSKRRQSDRAAYAADIESAMARLHAAPSAVFRATLANGFSNKSTGEDQFDSVLGVLAVLGVLTGTRPDTAPNDPWITQWEGWVLGQTALPRI